MRFFSMKNKVGNIVIKDHVIRYVELKQKQPLVLHTCEEWPLPEGVVRDGKIVDEEQLTHIMEQCVDMWKMKHRRIRFLVPDPLIVIRKIPLPTEIEYDDIRSYLFMEIGATIPLPFDDAVFDYAVLEKTKEALHVLLFAAPEASVMQYAELFEAVKLKPIVADISPLSLYRLFYNFHLANDVDHFLFVQFDLSSLNVSVFHQHRPIFTRQLAFDSQWTYWEKTNEGWKWLKEGEPERQLEDVYKELERVMSFYRFSLQKGEAQITRIVMTGDHPLVQTFSHLLQERLDVTVETLTLPLPIDPAYYLPIGLGLKEGNGHVSRN
ncbi:pilus assembly protein PilM [Anoxybacillus sp. LAT_35]|uniref:type IV pilus biogenesis protein PilM n=1 Tax=Anoxybacillus TaxID=150247 RepID=UPI001EDA7BEF|nr:MULTISPECIES: pilus assembly protein PilM [Anoxybacillus]MCG5024731.1 pilus assembly protein PilM [Anoxybacillus flavithermus]MCG6198134.1 pilus assembly protein PilM [Anoxybacillus sp. LAT_38]MCG3085996.1 pilus assembly protein PilM [Anoxybacillus sp. LAT27]MCG6172792.1 pilus assembly protein PilM [Anoxybacillus sp. LAT_11]MCG6173428.1 pilus assembly protein PilM [Anoxybacillus sp. LAT_11]